ncbi:thaumatin-like protein [Triticum urartu]|nr:thaumatin-like protein [Triticum urartu]
MAGSASATPVLLVVVVAALAAGASATSTLTPLSITNRCSFTVWPAVASAGLGTELHPGANWTVDASAIHYTADIWGRTGCSFDAAGRGRCQTADCGSGLRCRSTDPAAPATKAQVAISEGFYHYGITLDKGFNLPMDLTCSSGDALRCREDGCHDAFPYVKYNDHSCTAAGSRLQIVFCP